MPGLHLKNFFEEKKQGGPFERPPTDVRGVNAYPPAE
jgi:hypothetical protein